MRSDLDGEAVTTQPGLHLYLYMVESGEGHGRAENASTQCFAEKTHSEIFSELCNMEEHRGWTPSGLAGLSSQQLVPMAPLWCSMFSRLALL